MKKVDAEFGTKLNNITYINREAVYGILFIDNEVMVVKTPRGCFLPGGRIETNESEEDCLKREMAEEIGINVKVCQYIGKSVLYDKSPKDNIYYNMYGSFYIVKENGYCKKKEVDHKAVLMNIEIAIDKLKLTHQKWALKKLIDIITH